MRVRAACQFHSDGRGSGVALLGAMYLLPALLVALAASQPQPDVVTTTYGPVRGEDVNGVRVFRSIPFAADPVGALRFAPPQPPAPWTATKDVRGYGTPCAQLKLLGPLFLYGGEACLQLSLYGAPPPPGAPPRPVLFFIYGGAYVVGDEAELGWYDGVALAKAHPEMLVVAPNYRLGPLGFLALPELAGAGNAALLDQVAALEWVRDNIAAFGGDPARVTIAGESAGAFSVAWHLASPRSAGLFHGALLESTSFDTPQFFQPLGDARAFSALYGAALGCAEGAGQLACLRALPVDAVLIDLAEALNPDWPCVVPGRCPPGVQAAAAHLGGGSGSGGSGGAPRTLPALAPLMPWGPAIDGVVLPDVPLRAIIAGAFNKVPVLLGTNRNEGSIFIPVFPLIVPDTEFPPRLADIPKIVEHAYNMYDAATVNNLTNTLVCVGGGGAAALERRKGG